MQNTLPLRGDFFATDKALSSLKLAIDLRRRGALATGIYRKIIREEMHGAAVNAVREARRYRFNRL